MPDMLLEQALDVPFTFKQRPVPLPCDLRPGWRLYVLLLLLDQCRGGKATLQQLHVLNWAIRTEETRTAFLQFINGVRTPNQMIVRYDPSLNRAVEFAFAEGLVSRHEESPLALNELPQPTEEYRVILAPKGRRFLSLIQGMEDCLVAEKQFLAGIGRKVSQVLVEKLFTWGDRP
jgi:hypothetical protein